MSNDTEEKWRGIGKRLREIRQNLGLSQREMADNMGVGFRAYQNYEKGARGMPVEAIVRFMNWRGEEDASWILQGKRVVRIPEDLDALKRISAQLDARLMLRQQTIPSHKRARLMARWYESFLDGQEMTQHDIDILIDIAA